MTGQEAFIHCLKTYCEAMDNIAENAEKLSYDSMRAKADDMYVKTNPHPAFVFGIVVSISFAFCMWMVLKALM